MKSFWQSKINWAAIILVLTSLLPVIQNQDFSGMDFKGWVTFFIGTLIVVFRTFYTNTSIK